MKRTWTISIRCYPTRHSLTLLSLLSLKLRQTVPFPYTFICQYLCYLYISFVLFNPFFLCLLISIVISSRRSEESGASFFRFKVSRVFVLFCFLVSFLAFFLRIFLMWVKNKSNFIDSSCVSSIKVFQLFFCLVHVEATPIELYLLCILGDLLFYIWELLWVLFLGVLFFSLNLDFESHSPVNVGPF